MAVKTGKMMTDTYFELVQQFPLVRVRGDAHLAEAQEMIDYLLGRNLDEGEQQYLDVLTDLVEAYEDEHHPIPDAPEADVLRVLLQANNLNQVKLAKLVGMAQ